MLFGDQPGKTSDDMSAGCSGRAMEKQNQHTAGNKLGQFSRC
jgi:hypothetical protein